MPNIRYSSGQPIQTDRQRVTKAIGFAVIIVAAFMPIWYFIEKAAEAKRESDLRRRQDVVALLQSVSGKSQAHTYLASRWMQCPVNVITRSGRSSSTRRVTAVECAESIIASAKVEGGDQFAKDVSNVAVVLIRDRGLDTF